MVLLYSTLWLVKKTPHASLYTNHKCNSKTNHDVVAHVFPHLEQSACITLSSYWVFKVFSFLLIGRYDYFLCGFATLKRKALWLTHFTYGQIFLHTQVGTSVWCNPLLSVLSYNLAFLAVKVKWMKYICDLWNWVNTTPKIL